MGDAGMDRRDRVNTARRVEIGEADLPLHCPRPQDMLWNAHPRVFLPVEQRGEALCPYCGTLYVLKDGTRGSGH
jgi:uncharacterized Zn-finger protein